jgi:hypothetical protein
MVRLDADHLAQRGLENVHAFELFREHCIVVQEVGVVRQLLQGTSHEGVGLLEPIRLAQELGFRENELHALLVVGGAHALEMLTRAGEVSLLAEDLGPAHLGRKILRPARHFSIPAERLRILLLLLGDLPEIEPHGVRVAVVEGEKPLEIAFRRRPVLKLHREQRHGEEHLGVIGKLFQQNAELAAAPL